jgi:D-proline reductase (dithiol) PrdB
MNEFDSAHRIFVSYIDKSREYYLARGFGNPYRWAHHDDAPFALLRKPLGDCRVGLITTALLSEADRKSKRVYAASTTPPPSGLYTEHISWHKEATHTRDLDSFLPIRRVAECVSDCRIGSLSPRFYGVPTDFSQRRAKGEYALAVLDLCRADVVDIALLFPL